jgi:ATP-dependent DNA helicase RecG
MESYFARKIEFLRGVGPQKAELLAKEIGIFTYADLLAYYPFRYIDRTVFHKISDLTEALPAAQIKGTLVDYERIIGAKERIIGLFTDGIGYMELSWFQGLQYVEKKLKPGAAYIVFGKATPFNGKWNILHPEMELATQQTPKIEPVYSLTEKLKKRFVDSRQLSRWVLQIYQELAHIDETLPSHLIERYRLWPKGTAMYHIHNPEAFEHLHQAQRRIKFEELFYNQYSLMRSNHLRRVHISGQVFSKDHYVRQFLSHHLPFELTTAQVRVNAEIAHDMQSGKQMNRLLQGDVGSGKTVVGLVAMLLAASNEAQSCLMAPTEILADQHYKGLLPMVEAMGLKLAKLTGSTPKKDRVALHEGLQNGSIHMIVGTHALIEDVVQFKNLGLSIIDEQHRFGVAQRSKLWAKNPNVHPHVLVMTATPIPRTLGMTVYGELDLSVIDELPKGRKPIVTAHRYDADRLRVIGFIKEQIALGRQVYVVYPLIEESEKSDLKDLMDGYESMARAFPDLQLSIVHGKMKAKDKDFEMQRFVKNETQIMVATTVIEVGVNVPNASIMIVENAERFGLAQLHQLRGRVGRGAEQSYCILITDYKLSRDTKKRIDTLCRTNDGFEIAEVDMELRGPGDLAGTQQSGLVGFKLTNLLKDAKILEAARSAAEEILDQDPDLALPQHACIAAQIGNFKPNETNWAKIS